MDSQGAEHSHAFTNSRRTVRFADVRVEKTKQNKTKQENNKTKQNKTKQKQNKPNQKKKKTGPSKNKILKIDAIFFCLMSTRYLRQGIRPYSVKNV